MKTQDKLSLRKPTIKDAEAIMQFRQELIDFGSSFEGTNCLEQYADYKKWLENVKAEEKTKTQGSVVSEIYLLIREKDDKIVGK